MMKIQINALEATAAVTPSDKQQLDLLKKQRTSLIEAHKKSIEQIDASIKKLTSRIQKASDKVSVGDFLVKYKGVETKCKTLKSAMSKNPPIGARAHIHMGGVKIMTWATVDPITKRAYRGYNWHWVSLDAKAKYEKKYKK